MTFARLRFEATVAVMTVVRWVNPCRVAADDRCVMGSPVHPALHCPRRTPTGSMWCTKHDPERVA